MSEARAHQSGTAEREMTAVVAPAYGGSEVLRLRQVASPVPAAGEVLVRVRAAALCRGDVHLMTGKPYPIRLAGFGVRRPKYPVIGHDFAGEVADLGADVDDLAIGERVFGTAVSGAFADYVAVPRETVTRMPAGADFEVAAAIPDSGLTALQGLRDVGRLESGQSVLINGASGGVGTTAVQLARELGARVGVVCGTRHIDRMRELGADIVIDYTTTDLVEAGHRFDVVLDLIGNRSLRDWASVLTPGGVFVSSAGAPDGGVLFGPVWWLTKVVLGNLFTRRTLTPLLMRPNRADLEYLADLFGRGRLAPVIEHRTTLDGVPEALDRLALGHAAGKTVVQVAPG